MGWGYGAQNCTYIHQNAAQVNQYIVVPKTKNPPSLQLQKFGSPIVISQLILMLSAIEFDDQLLVDTGKVGNLWSDRVLAAKAAFQLVSSKGMP